MTVDEFELEVMLAYEELPCEIKERFLVTIDETNEKDFAYFSGYFPNMIHICYLTCSKHPDVKAHLKRVIKHEVEHLLFPTLVHKHSEHDE